MRAFHERIPSPRQHARADPVQVNQPGSPLDAPGLHSAVRDTLAVRAFQPQFGTDLSRVEVRRDGRAEALGTQAYAQGERIHLAGNAPAPDSAPGQGLLGHEVTHILQQREGRVVTPGGPAEPVVADAELEAEADTVGARVGRGEPAPSPLRGVSGAAPAAAAQGKAGDAPIQMFGALEHKTMGDVGAQQQPYRWDTAAEQAAGKRDINYGF
jgi:hypothetical protein